MMALAFAIADPEASTTMEEILRDVMSQFIVHGLSKRKSNYCLRHMEHWKLYAERADLSERSKEILQYWSVHSEVN